MKKNIYLLMCLPVFWIYSCEVNRSCCICSDPDPACFFQFGETLEITGFETGRNPLSQGGTVAPWGDTLSAISVNVHFDSIPCGSNTSPYFLKLELTDNSPIDAGSWSGGGLILNFSNLSEGLDIRGYNHFEFDLKIISENIDGQLADYIFVKLEDTEDEEKPERLARHYGTVSKNDWSTISIPLTEFGIVKASDTILHDWKPLLTKDVSRWIVSISNEQYSSAAIDGIIGFDNIRFVSK